MTVHLVPVNLDWALADESSVVLRQRLISLPLARSPLLDSEIVVVNRHFVDRVLQAPVQSFSDRDQFACDLSCVVDLLSIDRAAKLIDGSSVFENHCAVASSALYVRAIDVDFIFDHGRIVNETFGAVNRFAKSDSFWRRSG